MWEEINLQFKLFMLDRESNLLLELNAKRCYGFSVVEGFQIKLVLQKVLSVKLQTASLTGRKSQTSPLQDAKWQDMSHLTLKPMKFKMQDESGHIFNSSRILSGLRLLLHVL